MSRILALLLCLGTSLSAGMAQAQDPAEPAVTEDLRNVPLDVDRLKEHPALIYKLYAYRARSIQQGIVRTFEFGPVRVGAVVLYTQVYETGVTMEDTNWSWNGEYRSGRMGHVYRRDLLELYRFVRANCSSNCECRFDDGRFTCRGTNGDCAGDWPEHVLTPAALLRIVMLLPREAGRAYTVPYWSEDPCCGMVEEAPHSIICHGPEDMLLCGVETEVTRYSFGDTQLWVRNEDSKLVRVVRDGWFKLELACCKDGLLLEPPQVHVGEDGVPTPAVRPNPRPQPR